MVLCDFYATLRISVIYKKSERTIIRTCQSVSVRFSVWFFFLHTESAFLILNAPLDWSVRVILLQVFGNRVTLSDRDSHVFSRSTSEAFEEEKKKNFFFLVLCRRRRGGVRERRVRDVWETCDSIVVLYVSMCTSTSYTHTPTHSDGGQHVWVGGKNTDSHTPDSTCRFLTISMNHCSRWFGRFECPESFTQNSKIRDDIVLLIRFLVLSS